MARFDRYMLSQLLVLFGFFSLVLVSVYWVNRAIGLFDQLISDGQSALVFMEFTLLTLPYVILIVLPISAFVAAVYVTNRLSSDSEMVVLQTAGASSLRIGRPVIYFGVLVAILVAVLAHVLVPAARTELASRSQEISRDITAQFLKEGQFLHPTSEIAVYIRNITDLGELEELFLEDSRDRAAVVTYTAKQAFLVNGDDGPRLVMRDGLAQTFRPETGRLSTVAFEDFAYNIGALINSGGARARDLREFSTPVLLNPSEGDLASAYGDLPDFLFEAHDRFAKSLLAIVVPLMGFAALMLGGFSRFGVWRQVVIAVVLIILVQLVSNVAEDTARKDAALFWLAYAGPAFGGAIAAGLIYSTSLRRRRGRTPKGVPA
ncbi:LPS export ABC transporter permease LptF [Litoreibacter janthinus]|uniref:Lipopolysaccharide export system permease protein n=1 Tax=Litoreibacter janthinus TaxID=670154 RepID=A0A1I6H040_9RHOB|nr:LPS export ABC transporter permease LptF [Litoreibacter janthinus]SFR47798.1 lipopolysaccharide export system permease protein [Litoreibacter janthinus]